MRQEPKESDTHEKVLNLFLFTKSEVHVVGHFFNKIQDLSCLLHVYHPNDSH
jgi:hypothetical protein